jgi:hypothetical protein
MSDDDIFYSKRGIYLKETLTKEDFLSNPETREILENNHREVFDNNIKIEVKGFVESVFEITKTNTHLFQKTNLHELQYNVLNKIYENIFKEYDLDYFYENPEMAKSIDK